MEHAEAERFRAQLESLRQEIESELAQEDPTKDSITPDKAIGRLTRMEAIQAQSMSAAGRRRLQARLKKIERAFDRIEDRSYGDCLRCGEPIPEGRLEIVPESAFCVRCAARG
jgi:DnaK suppressor protein